MFNPFQKKRSVTLVLGGGSARGIAHVGVLKVFEREKIPIDMIVGTSMGALIGAAHAVGDPITSMERKAMKFSVNKLLDPIVPKLGMLAGNRLEGVIRTLLDGKTFDDCRIPFIAVTTDIETGEEVIHRTGDLSKVVRASCSWPGIFSPVKIDGRLLVDGGIKNSVPTRIARALGADYIIAVDVGFCVRNGKIENIFQMILQAFQIEGEELNKYQTVGADAVIKIDLPNIDQIAFERATEIIRRGQDSAEMKIAQIKRDLGIK